MTVVAGITNTTAVAVAIDLRTIRHWRAENERVREVAILYLGENSALLRCLIDLVGALPAGGRRELWMSHRELDESSILDDFSIARVAVDTAREIMRGSNLVDISNDDVNLILRPIEFAKYIPSGACSHKLLHSPIRLE